MQNLAHVPSYRKLNEIELCTATHMHTPRRKLKRLQKSRSSSDYYVSWENMSVLRAQRLSAVGSVCLMRSGLLDIALGRPRPSDKKSYYWNE